MSVFKFFDYTHPLGNFSWFLQILAAAIHVAWVSCSFPFFHMPLNTLFQLPDASTSLFKFSKAFYFLREISEPFLD